MQLHTHTHTHKHTHKPRVFQGNGTEEKVLERKKERKEKEEEKRVQERFERTDREVRSIIIMMDRNRALVAWR